MQGSGFRVQGSGFDLDARRALLAPLGRVVLEEHLVLSRIHGHEVGRNGAIFDNFGIFIRVYLSHLVTRTVVT